MKKQFLFFFMILLLVQAGAQKIPDTSRIRLVAKAYGDSIVLRWAPSTPGSWQLLNKTGYNILRMERNSAAGNWTQLNAKPVVPLSLDEMKSTLDRNNKFAAIAAQALYGKTIYPVKKGMAPEVTQEADLLSDRFALCLQCADYSAPVAKAVGLGWTDKTVKRGEAYLYKIVPAKAVPIIPVSLVVVNEREEEGKRPQGLLAIGGDKKAELQWPRNQQEPYSGYQVEISDDGKNFRSLHDAPFYTSLPDTALRNGDSVLQAITELLQQNHVFIDSLKKNYQTYYYRIRGINAFAEWSPYSDAVPVLGRDLTPPSSVILGTPEPEGRRSLRLAWTKPVKENDLKGYFVYRSRKVDEGYSLLQTQPLPATATGFVDTEAFEHGPNFYRVSAFDTAGNQNASFPVMGLLPDTTAPAVPKELKGSIDKDGLVHLAWQANRDEDMKGYKVYFSHDPQQPFVQITLYPTPETDFTDSITLKTLTKKIYYRIVAVDQNNNHSDYSSILELKKPDIVPPTPPVILNASVISGGVQLEFSNSASTDAVRYVVARKEAGADWKTIGQLRHDAGTKGFHIRDTSLKHGVVYEYAAKVVDEDSLSSAWCTPVRMQLRGTEQLAAISFSKAGFDPVQQAVVLQWNYTASEPFYFVVYRSVAGSPLERYRTLDKGSKEFRDLQVPQIDQGYQYAIQAVYQHHSKRTGLEKAVTVKK